MNHPVEEWGNHPHLRHVDRHGTCLSHSSHSMRNKRYTSTQKPSQGAQTQRKTMGTPQHSSGYCRPFPRAESPVVIVSMVRFHRLMNHAKKLKRLLNNPKISYENVFVNTSANKNQLSIRPPTLVSLNHLIVNKISTPKTCLSYLVTAGLEWSTSQD